MEYCSIYQESQIPQGLFGIGGGRAPGTGRFGAGRLKKDNTF